jgi:mannose-6-phosphate isomerase-like protein (cupin superfamily)
MDAHEYVLDTTASNLAKIALQERYPAKGYVVNTKSEMIVYILEGKVGLDKNDNEVTLEKGDAALVKINEKYSWQPDGEVSLLIFSTPSWTPDQQKIAE